MEASVINVGNSKGIIIPAKFLKLLGLTKRVKIDLEDNKIVISPLVENVREGWDEMILKEIQKNGQEEQLIPDVFEDENLDDWTW